MTEVVNVLAAEEQDPITTPQSVEVLAVQEQKIMELFTVEEERHTIVVEEEIALLVTEAECPVVVTEEETIVVAGGEAGPPGPQGPPGPAGGGLVEVVAGTVLSGHRMVRLDEDGLAVYASNLDPECYWRVLGMTAGAALAGKKVYVVTGGEFEEPSWNWMMEQPVFLGVDGQLTQAVPQAPEFQLIVGFPMEPTKLFLRQREPIVLN